MDSILSFGDACQYISCLDRIFDGSEGPNLVDTQRAGTDKAPNCILNIMLPFLFIFKAGLLLLSLLFSKQR